MQRWEQLLHHPVFELNFALRKRFKEFIHVTHAYQLLDKTSGLDGVTKIAFIYFFGDLINFFTSLFGRGKDLFVALPTFNPLQFAHGRCFLRGQNFVGNQN